MTVKDSCGDEKQPMAKRQKVDSFGSDAKNVLTTGDSADDKTSNEMIAAICAATRTPDINIVDFSDDISDIKITPGPEPLSDSDIPPRPPKHKKKKHKKAERSQKLQADNGKSQKKDERNDSTSTDAQAT